MYSANVEECFLANKGLRWQIASKCYGRLQRIGSTDTFDDVMSAVTESFLRAHAGFKPELGFAFSTYMTRSAYNAINKAAKVVEMERVEFGTRHVSEFGEEDGEFDILERIAGDSASPEQLVERRQAVRALMARLSPVAALIVNWLVEPPPELTAELERHRAHDAYCKSVGVRAASHSGLTINFVARFIILVDPSSATEVAKGVKEVKNLIDSL